MLETTSRAALGEGGPHYGSPDKLPARAARDDRGCRASSAIPFTTGILIGIGETRGGAPRGAGGDPRPARAARPHPGGDRPELPREAGHEDGRRIPSRRSRSCSGRRAAARILLGADVNVQVPPNLSYDEFPRLLDAGINDWGGDLAGDDRPREPGGAVARDRAAARGDRGARPRARRRGSPIYPEYVARPRALVRRRASPRRAPREPTRRAWPARSAGRPGPCRARCPG